MPLLGTSTRTSTSLLASQSLAPHSTFAMWEQDLPQDTSPAKYPSPSGLPHGELIGPLAIQEHFLVAAGLQGHCHSKVAFSN